MTGNTSSKWLLWPIIRMLFPPTNWFSSVTNNWNVILTPSRLFQPSSPIQIGNHSFQTHKIPIDRLYKLTVRLMIVIKQVPKLMNFLIKSRKKHRTLEPELIVIVTENYILAPNKIEILCIFRQLLHIKNEENTCKMVRTLHPIS